ncbi:MAG: AraC family transcriptional regulator [Mangrovibacterium sp.]
MRRKEGFPGQQSYVIPDRIQALIRHNPVCEDLYVTDIGYYPQAVHHFRERKEGVEQTILIYNVAGSGFIHVSGRETRLDAGHFFIIPEGLPHAYAACPKNPWSIYWIHVSGRKSGYLARPALQSVPVLPNNNSRINERIDLFREIFRSLERGYSIETLEYVNLCLPRLLATFSYLSQYRSFKEQIAMDPVSRSINYMLEHISQKISLEELAGEVSLSMSHFSRLFQSRTGHSPVDYHIQLKIQHSCRLLDNTGLSVSDVAREAGYEDPFYFSRQFRKVMNMSPREYRKR